MSACTVLNCEDTVTGRFTTNEKVFMETAVCDDHLLRLQGGEPWQYKGSENVLLMGNDLPPVLTTFQIKESVGNGVTLVLQTEGDAQPLSVWVPNELATKLGTWLTPDTED